MLKKLSLAALVAMGSVSFASATPLTEAIKNVNVNGYLRLRFYNETPDKGDGYNRWRTNAKFIFTIPVSEHTSFVWRVSDQTDVRDRATSNVKANVDVNLLDNLFFLKYSKDGLNAIVGKIPVLTPITSADPQTTAHGAGAIATYNVGNGLTVAAGWVDANVNHDNFGALDAKVTSSDIYTAAAIYSNKDAGINNFQVWYFNVTNLVDYLWAVRADLDLFKMAGINNDFDIQFHVDGAISNLDDDISKEDSHTYYNVSATAKSDAFCAKIGWAQTNDKAGVAAYSVDAPINAVETAQQRYGIANDTDAAALYGKIGYTVDAKTNVYVEATNIHEASKNNSVEYVVGGNYKVNKKFTVGAYYSVLDYTDDAEKLGNVDNNEFRFEAKYTF